MFAQNVSIWHTTYCRYRICIYSLYMPGMFPVFSHADCCHQRPYGRIEFQCRMVTSSAGLNCDPAGIGVIEVAWTWCRLTQIQQSERACHIYGSKTMGPLLSYSFTSFLHDIGHVLSIHFRLNMDGVGIWWHRDTGWHETSFMFFPSQKRSMSRDIPLPTRKSFQATYNLIIDFTSLYYDLTAPNWILNTSI